jgi:DNA polymerase elongation subunit (family B)
MSSIDMLENTPLHGSVIRYSELKQTLPKRYNYTDPQKCEKINQLLDERKEILFLPTYLQETSIQDEKYKKAKYKIILSGIFTDGRKVNVVIDGIEPYFEVRIPNLVDGTIKVGRGNSIEYITPSQYIKRVRLLLDRDEITKPEKTSMIKGKPFKYYQEHKSNFIRFYYLKIKNRKEAIKLVRNHGYETTTDDLSCYYRVVCRDYLTSFSTWIKLNNYYEDEVKCLKDITYRINIKDYKPYDGEMSLKKTPDLLKDKTLSMTWDIETWSKEGDVPLPENATDCIFCIGMTFQWVNDQNPFLRIALVDYPSNAKPDHLTIICGSEKNIIKAFADVFEKMRPDFIIGFNDSDYDWNWLINRACVTKGLVSYVANKLDSNISYRGYNDADIMKYNYKKEHVKVEAGTYSDGFTLMMNGYIPIDVRTIFRRLYPTAEQSNLKWYLAKNKLSGKDDMPYQTMFKIYAKLRTIRESEFVKFSSNGDQLEFEFNDTTPITMLEDYQSLKAQLADVNKYCVVDALRCHELIKIRSVIMDHREVSNVSYCSLYDAFYRANGMKVRNITIAIGQNKNLPFGVRFSNVAINAEEEGKYPGAYVVAPKKGLQTSKLSIKERVAKAHLTEHSKRKDLQEWLFTSDDEIEKFYDIIDEYGPVVTEQTKIDEIEEKWGKLPKKFKDFMSEFIGRPITGLDFASLYPSLIRAYNLSPEYCIKNKAHAREVNEKGQHLTKVDFEFNGRRRKAWFVWHNNKIDPYLEDGKTLDPEFQFGVYPYILNKLYEDRKKIKKNMKIFVHQIEEMDVHDTETPGYISKNQEDYDEICFQYNYLNSKQLALKVFMNTFYGEAGNKLSPFFVLEVAGGITTWGVRSIKLAKKFVEDRGCNVRYGDSVAEYTPILVRKDGDLFYIEFKDLASNKEYRQYNGGKEIAFIKGYEIWSDQGWTDIKHVIRHKTNKKMYRVITHTSVVDVTEDHSLLDDQAKEIRTGDALGASLLLNAKPDLTVDQQLVSEELAWVIGLFVASGSCDKYAYDSKSSWAINSLDKSLLNKSILILEQAYPGYTFKILDNSCMYKLIPSNPRKESIQEIVDEWYDICYYGKCKIVPNCILGSDLTIQKSFLNGYYWGDGDKLSGNNTDFDIKSQLFAFKFQMLCINLGYNVSVSCRKDKLDIYRLTITKSIQRKNPKVVTKLMELPQTTAYVYDIETKNHHFAAGFGDIIVHNTDSIYLSVPNDEFTLVDKLYYSGKISKLDYWTKLVEITFTTIKGINIDINDMFILDNRTKFLSMAYEEVLYPVVFTAKKKYYGIPHENLANFKPKNLFIRGLEVKKRGVSELLKTIFNELMWASVNPDNLYSLLELIQDKIDDIYASRSWVIEDFIQTDVFRPNKNNIKVHTFVRRMAEQGIEILSNNRFKYVIVKKYPYKYDYRGRKSNLTIGDKMEKYEVALEKKLEVDLDHYMSGGINGQLARLVVYHEMFHVNPIDNTSEELKIAEDKIYKNATKFVDEYCKQYYSNYNTFGKTYQNMFKTANKLVGGCIKKNDDLTYQLITANVPDDDFEEWFIDLIDKKSVKMSLGHGAQHVNGELRKIDKLDRNGKIKILQKVYYGIPRKSILDIRKKSFRETMSILRRRVREDVTEFRTLYSVYHHGIELIIDVLKDHIKISQNLFEVTDEVKSYKFEDFSTELDVELVNDITLVATTHANKMLNDKKLIIIMDKFKVLYQDILSSHLVIRRTESIVDTLKSKRNSMNRVIMRPDDDIINSVIESNIQQTLIDLKDIDI